MGLIYCGIDEAGYGPMLGPLCVGFSAFRIEEWDPEGGAPDLWALLEGAVCREGRDARRRIAVADSKKLKLSNQLKTKHPLVHLERGVLAFAGLVEGEPRLCEPCRSDPTDASEEHGRHGRGTREIATDADLFEAIGVHFEPHEWYGGEPVSLPLSGSGAQLAIARNKLGLACDGAGVEPLALACIAVGEGEFNDVVRRGGSKANLIERSFARFLRRVIERWGAGDDDVRVVCDRHGGRTGYSRLLERAVDGLGHEVDTLEESERCSRYRVGGRAGLLFMPEAEDAHLPVALASMTAKLVRELAMGRFNRYWCGRLPELKPTAGYVQDARRWLADAGESLTAPEREAMVRMA